VIEGVEELFRRQVVAWPLLGRGVAALAASETRREVVAGSELLVRHIPHRAASTTAAVDSASVAKRRCFLCAGNLDPEEEGLPFGSDYTIYCNPFPIVEKHLTIVHREHRPQRIEGQLGAMLDLASALPGLFVVYNGPECGASAPDHMHFQAGSRDGLPVVGEARAARERVLSGFSRTGLVFRGAEPTPIAVEVTRALEALSSLGDGRPRGPEPWCNIAAFHDESGFTVVVFPRAKHRPEVFHTGELTVSPAAIDLCGIFVVPLEKDFRRISGTDIEAVFREVSVPRERLEELLAAAGSAR
jgi:hypothetical protein